MRSVFCIRIDLDNWPEDKPSEQGSILSENQNQEHRAFSTLWYVKMSNVLLQLCGDRDVQEVPVSQT